MENERCPPTFFVSPEGFDGWNGLEPSPSTHGTDGPLATLGEAVKRVRALREQNLLAGAATIRLAAGTYFLPNPQSLAPDDSHLKIVGIRGETILDGSIPVLAWQHTQVNGNQCWMADLKGVVPQGVSCRSLVVNGSFRERARYPSEGWLRMEDVPDTHPSDFQIYDGAQRFTVAEGDFSEDWRNRTDIEAVVNHLWVEERMPVAAYDSRTRLVTSTHRSTFTLRNHAWMDSVPTARFYWDNVFEGLNRPGQWYLDRGEQCLYYLPRQGETPGDCDIRLGVLDQLVRIHGDWQEGKKVQNIHFEGVTFANTNWGPSRGFGRWWDPGTPPHAWPEKDSFRHFRENNFDKIRLPSGVDLATSPQIAHDLPGVLSLEAAENCSFSECTFQSLGFYAADVRGGCRYIRFERNLFTECGAGAVKIDGADLRGDVRLRTSHVAVADCTIRSCGRIFSAAAGVAILHAARNTVEHNEFCDLFYSAISVGWTWGHERTICQENVIQFNHIHRIGQGRLSDLGGIYLLGLQPGTIVKGNHIHHISAGHYGGSGIYLDEGASHIRVEGNLVHHTQSVGYSDHFVRSIVVIDNLFALCGRHGTFFSREEPRGYGGNHPPPGTLFLRNVVYIDGVGMFRDVNDTWGGGLIDSDLNLFFNRADPVDPVIWNCEPYPDVAAEKQTIRWSAVREQGLERNSIVADPLFRDPERGDFSVPANSPVHQLGMHIPDPSKAGPRKREEMKIPRTPGYKRHGAKLQFG